MEIKEVYEAYLKSDRTESTLNQHKGKIEKYISFIGNQDIEKAFSEELLRKFVFEHKKIKPAGKYDALTNFFKFYYEDIKNISKLDLPKFPIDSQEIGKNNKNDEMKVIYFDKENFDFNALFDDKYYEHLNNKEAAVVVKASLALALSAGYDSGELFPTNHNLTTAMKMKDFQIEEDYIKVKNFYDHSTVPFIFIQGKYIDYLKEYYQLRKSIVIKEEQRKELFIVKTWNTKELNYDSKYTKRKIYNPYELVSYMLTYITSQLGVPTPQITDLKANMVLHSLYKSKGSALQDIIELYGYRPFVKHAFERYCLTTSRNDEPIFSVLSLEEDISEDKLPNNELDSKKKQESRIDIIDRLVRDSTKVKQLKELYDNKCQICNEQITFIDEIKYSEVHHVQPLNKEHHGVDEKSNMIVLCPNHHQIFDMGIIALDPENHQRILHIDKQNSLHNKFLVSNKHKLSSTCVRYHYENIFKPLRDSLLN